MKISDNNICDNDAERLEGEIYKTVTTFGKTFELRFGYYDDIDRNHPPDIIYPDFIKSPIYAEGGEPFVTMMQDACASYKGKSKKTPDTTCAECKHFKRGEEWFGICINPKNIK